VAVLIAHAAAYAAARTVEADASAVTAATAGGEAAAAHARVAREVLGLPLLVAAQVRGAQASAAPSQQPAEKLEPSGAATSGGKRNRGRESAAE
jgi:hypothetical protein